MKWYALDVQLLPNRKRKDFIPYWYQPPFRDWNTKWRIKYSSLKRSNYRNATDRVSVFRATDKLHAMPNSGKKIYIIFCSWPFSSLLLKEIFFSPSRKAFNWRFCPGTSLWPQAHRFWGERDINTKYCHEFREVLIWLRERNSSSTLRKCTRWILSLHFFNGDQRAAQRKTFGIVTFCLLLPTRFVTSWDFCREDYN